MQLRSECIAELLEAGGRLGEEDDPLVITPTPDLEELRQEGSASVDLRLGTWFVTLRHARMSHLEVDAKEPGYQFTKTQYVPFGQSYYLHPRSFVLGITLEWVRLPGILTGYVIGKSSWGRRGLIIATATAVHPGFKGCLTLELTNVGEIPIAIRPGMRICQLCLLLVKAEDQGRLDCSQFVGSRMPNLGSIRLDEVASALASGRASGEAVRRVEENANAGVNR